MNFYFTFGCGQPNAGTYVHIKAENELKARELMFSKYGREWCACYTDLNRVHHNDRNRLETIEQEA